MLPEQPPSIRRQVKPVKDENTADDPGSAGITGESRKRTASNAELDVPTSKKSKVDANGTIHLDDDDDDLEIL